MYSIDAKIKTIRKFVVNVNIVKEIYNKHVRTLAHTYAC